MIFSLILIDINFSADFGITVTLSIPGNNFFARKGRIRWELYPEKLCINIERKCFSLLLFRLHDLCAAPRYFPVRCSWSLTLGSNSENG